MNPALALLRLRFRCTPSYLWSFPLLAFASSTSILFDGEYSGFSPSLLMEQTIFLSLMGGLMYFAQKTNHLPRLGQLAEFQLARPILRHHLYYTNIGLFFLLTLAPFTLAFLLTVLRDPSLAFSLFQNTHQSTEAARHLPAYQAAFPHSLIVSAGRHDSLLIPHGAIYVAAWGFLILLSIALFIQTILLLPLPKSWRIAFCYGPLALLVLWQFSFLPSGEHLSLAQLAFFSFVRHWPLWLAAVVALTTLIQLCARRAAPRFEAD